MKAFWCVECGPGNFGDELTPVLLAAFGISCEHATPGRADLVMVGSVLSRIPAGWRGTVLGTGLIREGLRADLRRARVLAVRGSLTASRARVPRGTPLGDPGILAPIVLRHRPPADLDRVLVPHYIDHDLARRFPGTPVVGIRQHPVRFMAAIARAREVYTSSLHALIAADSLGIPHVWFPHEGVVGGAFKFNDYVSAFDSTIRPRRQRLTDPTRLAERARVLADLIASLPGRLDD